MRKRILIALLVVSFLIPFTTRSSYAENTFTDAWKKTTGIVLGITVAPMVGLARGFTKGWLWGAETTAEALGNANGVPHRMVGFATGGVVGAAAGGVSGVFMGAYDGIKYGWDKPWSSENLSWAGSGFTDYDPFAFAW